MQPFFANTQSKSVATHGVSSFELPILYFRDDLFMLVYTASLEKVKGLMPSDKLHPVHLPGNRALVGIAAFNYIETSIGPYGEVGVVIPAVYGPKPPPAVIPTLIESRYPGFGALVMHLPVTNRFARDAGRGEWGYTKFVADMHFTITPEFMECRLSEEDHHILTLHVVRQGMVMKERKPLVTYSVKDGNLIKTRIPQKGSFRFSIGPRDSYIHFGDHSVAHSIANLELAANPLMSRYYHERAGILPAGDIIEQDVRSLDGYFGKDRDGEHQVNYLGTT